MSRYTLKTYYGHAEKERYEHRSASKLLNILNHPKHHRAGETGPFGEVLEHVNRVEIYDSMREKLFEGTVDDALIFSRTLK